MRVFVFLAAFATAGAAAQEIVTLQTRPGVSVSFFVPGALRNPDAVALVLSGGGGKIGLRQEDGRIRFSDRNFLLHSPHGYYGVEAPTVDAITAWMLKKPFAKDLG